MHYINYTMYQVYYTQKLPFQHGVFILQYSYVPLTFLWKCYTVCPHTGSLNKTKNDVETTEK